MPPVEARQPASTSPLQPFLIDDTTTDTQYAGYMRYFEAAARAALVPEQWVEDAAQDIAVIIWKYGFGNVTAVRWATMNAAKRYRWQQNGTYLSERRVTGREFGETLATPGDAHALTDRLLDLKRVWGTLTLLQRRSLVWDGNADVQCRSARRSARIKLRKLAA